MRTFIAKLSTVLLLSLPLLVYGQMGMRMPAPDYDEGTFKDPFDFWVVLILSVLMFVGPALIAKSETGDGAGITYWKWWFITATGSFLMMSLSEIPLVVLITALIILSYGVLRE